MPPSSIAIVPLYPAGREAFRGFALLKVIHPALFNKGSILYPSRQRFDHMPGVIFYFCGSCHCHATPVLGLLPALSPRCVEPCAPHQAGHSTPAALARLLHHPHALRPAGSAVFRSDSLQPWAELAGLSRAAADPGGVKGMILPACWPHGQAGAFEEFRKARKLLKTAFCSQCLTSSHHSCSNK